MTAICSNKNFGVAYPAVESSRASFFGGKGSARSKFNVEEITTHKQFLKTKPKPFLSPAII